MKKLIKLCIILGMISSEAVAQQDAIFSQYTFNPLFYNPAYASVYEMTSFTSQNRAQSLGAPTFAVTNALSGFASFKTMGFGLNVVSDRVGLENGNAAFRNIQTDLIYAYKIQLGEMTYISAGLQAGISNKRVGFDDLTLKYQDDPTIAQTTAGATRVNFGTGLFLLNEEKYYLGVSIPRILNSTFKDGSVVAQEYKRHYYISGGMIIGGNSNIPIRPSFLVRTAKGTDPAIDLNASALLSEIIWVGAGVRNFNTLMFIGQLDISDYFRVAYSLDIPSSRAVMSHELSLNINLSAFKDQVVPAPRYF